MPQPTSTNGPLSGVRVLELAAVVAGPTACQVMADLGADVVKVEPPSGDAARHVGTAVDGVPLWWKHLGRNKRSIGLDLARPAGREVLHRLVDGADVLVESFRPGTLERWGLAPDALLERNPDLIVGRISGFGHTGPYAERAAFGTLVEAMSGFASVNGPAEGPPTLPPIALADYLTGYAACIGVLAALHARAGGRARGQVVEVNLLASLLAVMNLQILQCGKAGLVPARIGSRMTTTAPRNVYPTSDGRWVAVSGTTLRTARQLVELVGRPDLADEPWFATGAGRYAHVELLDQVVAAWTGARPLAAIMSAAERAGVTLAPVNDVADLLADPAIVAGGQLQAMADPELGEVVVPGLLCNLQATPGRLSWLGQPLGASTEDVLRELSFGDDEVQAMRESGVVV